MDYRHESEKDTLILRILTDIINAIHYDHECNRIHSFYLYGGGSESDCTFPPSDGRLRVFGRRVAISHNRKVIDFILYNNIKTATADKIHEEKYGELIDG